MRGLRRIARSWLAHPVLTGAACLSLAVGTAGAGALWALADSLFFPAWGVREPQSLVRLSLSRTDLPAPATTMPSAVWDLAQSRLTALDGLAAAGADRLMVEAGGDARLTDVLFVSGTFFDVVAPSMVAGRPLIASDDRPGAEVPAAVIGDLFRRDVFGGDTDPIGRSLMVEGRPVTVVGVVDAAFFGIEVGKRTDVFLPLAWEAPLKGSASRLAGGRAWWLSVLGRAPQDRGLASVTAQANVELASIVDAPGFENAQSVAFELLPTGAWPSALKGQYGEALLLLVAVTALILCVTSINAAAAMVARFGDRLPEIAVRYALGARRRQVIGGLLGDTLALAIVGTIGGMCVAVWIAVATVPSLTLSGDRGIIPHVAVSPSWRLIAISAAAAVATGLFIGAWPAVRASREALRAHVGSSSVTGGGHRAVMWLVAAQLAVSVALVGVGAVFVRSYVELTRQTSTSVNEVLLLSLSGSSSEGLPLARIEDLLDRVRAVPGVQAASVSTYTPLSGLIALAKVDVPGFLSSDIRDAHATVNRVAPGFFDVFGPGLLEGRAFGEGDRAGTPLVAVVNREFSRHYLGDTSAVGRAITLNGEQVTIVGEVETAKYRNLREPPMRFVYLPFAQGRDIPQTFRFGVRADDPLAMRGPLLQAVRAGLPDASVRFQTLAEEIGESVGRERLVARLSGFYGVLALLMSMTGLYGTCSYLVTRRRKEIGVRMALGAGSLDIVRMVLRETMSVLGIGTIVGLMIAAGVSRALASRLFGIEGGDDVTLTVAVAMFALCALVATMVPARRAARAMPIAELRCD